jgi:hypothetical protein
MMPMPSEIALMRWRRRANSLGKLNNPGRVFHCTALNSPCLIGSAMAQSCENKAVSAEGKPLHRAAKFARPMSAIPPKADIVGRNGDVRFVPKADILRCSKNTSTICLYLNKGAKSRDRFAHD